MDAWAHHNAALNDISVTKFLDYDEFDEENDFSDWEDEEYLMENGMQVPNDQEIEKNARKKRGRKNKSKKKKAQPFGNSDEDVVIVEFLDANPDYYGYWV